MHTPRREAANVRRRYHLVLFAVGWMVAVAILFQIGLGSGAHAVYGRFRDSFADIAQRFRDRDTKPPRQVLRGSRRDFLKPLRPVLDSRAALANPDSILFGAYDSGLPNTVAGIEAFENQLNFCFPIISFYSAWGGKPAHEFPTRMVETITAMGSVPLVTWEPFVVDFDETLHSQLPRLAEREYATLNAIARGDYDFYIEPWAAAAADFRKPMFIRFANEMNDPYRYPWGPQNGNRPEDYIAAWKHVHDVFQKKGASNVLWVWSPRLSMPWFEYYYPGDEYVDWIGASILNYGTVANWSRWWTFQQLMEKPYPALLKMNKPIMICELATVGAGGDMTEWYRDAFYHIDHTYRRGIHAVVFFNEPADVTMSTFALNWTIGQSPRSVAVVSEQLAGHRP